MQEIVIIAADVASREGINQQIQEWRGQADCVGRGAPGPAWQFPAPERRGVRLRVFRRRAALVSISRVTSSKLTSGEGIAIGISETSEGAAPDGRGLGSVRMRERSCSEATTCFKRRRRGVN